MNKPKLISQTLVLVRQCAHKLEDISCNFEDLKDYDGVRKVNNTLICLDRVLGHLEEKAELNSNSGQYVTTLMEHHAEKGRDND